MSYTVKNIIYRVIKKIRALFGVDPDIALHGGWYGNYKTWDDALKQTTGYDEDSILKKIRASVLKVINGEAQYERDSIAFETFEYSAEFLNALKMTVKNNSLSVIDFGGSLGSQYFQYKRFFEGVDINWLVVEQVHFVDCGNKDIANDQLKFFKTIDEALKYKAVDTIILSSVLPYVKDPFALMETIKAYHFNYIIIDRNPFIELDKDILTVQVVPESIYKASYPAWFFNEAKFIKTFSDSYRIEKEIKTPFTASTIVNRVKASWKGFILVKKS